MFKFQKLLPPYVIAVLAFAGNVAQAYNDAVAEKFRQNVVRFIAVKLYPTTYAANALIPSSDRYVSSVSGYFSRKLDYHRERYMLAMRLAMSVQQNKIETLNAIIAKRDHDPAVVEEELSQYDHSEWELLALKHTALENLQELSVFLEQQLQRMQRAYVQAEEEKSHFPIVASFFLEVTDYQIDSNSEPEVMAELILVDAATTDSVQTQRDALKSKLDSKK